MLTLENASAERCSSNSIVGTSEVHGNPFTLRKDIQKRIRSHHPFLSPCLDSHGSVAAGRGGVAVLVKYDLLGFSPEDFFLSRTSSVFRLVIFLRVAEVALEGNARATVLSSAFYMTVPYLPRICFPSKPCFTMVCVNQGIILMVLVVLIFSDSIDPKGEDPVPMDKPVLQNSDVSPGADINTRPFQRRWESMFENLIEIVFKAQTHFNVGAGVLNRTDRMFTTIPWSATVPMRHSAGVVKDECGGTLLAALTILLSTGAASCFLLPWFLVVPLDPRHWRKQLASKRSGANTPSIKNAWLLLLRKPPLTIRP